MPIYQYACSSCQHREEHLQKIHDPLLTQCPKCGQASYSKQLTAAGFQLKGSGWYATDFKTTANTNTSSAPTEAAAHSCSDSCKH